MLGEVILLILRYRVKICNEMSFFVPISDTIKFHINGSIFSMFGCVIEELLVRQVGSDNWGRSFWVLYL